MSIFRTFNKTLSASKFSRPNNVILTHCCPAVYLCTLQQPSIDHLNTLKSLFKTINRLEAHSNNASYQAIINKQLQFLRKNTDFYLESCLRYVEAGGRLTAQGLANLYAHADQLKVNALWLQTYGQPQIPHLIRNMSVQNLKDLHEGLKKHNGSADFIGLVEKQLKSRNQEQYEYVTRAPNEIATFEQAKPYTHNLLLNALDGNQSTLIYQARKIWQFQADLIKSFYEKNTGRYALD